MLLFVQEGKARVIPDAAVEGTRWQGQPYHVTLGHTTWAWRRSGGYCVELFGQPPQLHHCQTDCGDPLRAQVVSRVAGSYGR